MTYNLLDEAWLPVRRASGAFDWIAPYQISERDDPPIGFASGRPDFDGAYPQFLIGLLQTAVAPADEATWRRWFRDPPAPDQLRECFAVYHHAFNLDGDGPRFMQDLELDVDDSSTKEFPIRALLIDDANAELFQSSAVDILAQPFAAAALFCLQINAPAGGAGHRTSLRGGGPLTTLVATSKFWESLWLNVSAAPDFDSVPGNVELSDVDVFPWLAATRTSSSQDPQTLPIDVHPLQHYWSMPRRIRLSERQHGVGCTTDAERGYGAFHMRKHGVKYDGPFEHPLTPHRIVKPGQPPNPKKGAAAGVPYRDWAAMTVPFDDARPALAVQVFVRRERYLVAPTASIRAFGYDMDNMKARAWTQHEVPLFAVAPDLADEFSTFIASLIKVSEEVRGQLTKQLRKAIKRRAEDAKTGDLVALFGAVNQVFWAATEAEFIRIATAASSDDDGHAHLAERWLTVLHRAALDLFEEHSQLRGAFSELDPKRVVLALRDLRQFTHPNASKLRKILGLPVIEKKSAKKAQRRGKTVASTGKEMPQ